MTNTLPLKGFHLSKKRADLVFPIHSLERPKIASAREELFADWRLRNVTRVNFPSAAPSTLEFLRFILSSCSSSLFHPQNEGGSYANVPGVEGEDLATLANESISRAKKRGRRSLCRNSDFCILYTTTQHQAPPEKTKGHFTKWGGNTHMGMKF